MTQNANQALDTSIISFTFASKNSNYFLNNDGVLINVKFNAYLPSWQNGSPDSPKSLTSTISSSITVVGNNCLTISPSSSDPQVSLIPVCGNDIREINISNLNYFMDDINPNPIGSDGAQLHFGIANDGYTELKIINSNGEIVGFPMKIILNPVIIHFDYLSKIFHPGFTLVILNSYPFYSTKKFILVK